MNTLKQDLRHGLTAESVRKNDFDTIFGSLSKTGTYDSFDFQNDIFFVEHKERSIPFGKYPTLYFDRVKYDEYLRLKRINPRHRFVIIWTCLGHSYFWEFTENDEDENGLGTFYFDEMLMDRRRGTGWKHQALVHVFLSAVKPLSEFK